MNPKKTLRVSEVLILEVTQRFDVEEHKLCERTSVIITFHPNGSTSIYRADGTVIATAMYIPRKALLKKTNYACEKNKHKRVFWSKPKEEA